MNFPIRRFVFVACAIVLTSIAHAKAEDFNVVLDQAGILKLPERAATIVIGNPSIADASLQTGGLLVVTGKGFGTTNLIALDSRGNALAEYTLNVSSPRDGRITVWRGVERETWACAPRCEHSIALGDASGYFEAAVSQAGTRNGASTGLGTPATK